MFLATYVAPLQKLTRLSAWLFNCTKLMSLNWLIVIMLLDLSAPEYFVCRPRLYQTEVSNARESLLGPNGAARSTWRPVKGNGTNKQKELMKIIYRPTCVLSRFSSLCAIVHVGDSERLDGRRSTACYQSSSNENRKISGHGFCCCGAPRSPVTSMLPIATVAIVFFVWPIDKPLLGLCRSPDNSITNRS